MMKRQLMKPKWALTIPALLSMILAFFLLSNARFLPELKKATQSSRMAAWEEGLPFSHSYGEILGQSHYLNPKAPSLSRPSFLERTSGDGWDMWDRSSILFDQMNLTCNWNEYRPFSPGEKPLSVPFCAHPLSDDHFVSNNIVKKGRHLECDSLPILLANSVGSKEGGDSENNPVIYIDIGANIGTCVMQMLLTTDAEIMAFEPHPYNLFAMTSTFMKLEEKLRNRIHLFPIALGAEPSDSTIHMASDNRGHAVVSKVIRINNKATFLPPMPIRVEPLDSILIDTATVHLIKMDAQGFECYIFDGMKRVLQRSKSIFFELEKKVLNGFDRCSPQLLWDKFLKAGFEMHVGGTNKPATTKLPDRGKVNIVAFNM